MDNTNSYFCFCDRCHQPIVKEHGLEHWHINLCSVCSLELYRKIFGDQQKE